MKLALDKPRALCYTIPTTNDLSTLATMNDLNTIITTNNTTAAATPACVRHAENLITTASADGWAIERIERENPGDFIEFVTLSQTEPQLFGASHRVLIIIIRRPMPGILRRRGSVKYTSICSDGVRTTTRAGRRHAVAAINTMRACRARRTF